MGDTQIYRVFLDNPPSDQFLFAFKIDPALRPKVGDSLTNPTTFREFIIIRDEFTSTSAYLSDGGFVLITDDNQVLLTDGQGQSANVTHNYFVQPANNPQRVVTWTSSRFDDDQTLKQLFR